MLTENFPKWSSAEDQRQRNKALYKTNLLSTSQTPVNEVSSEHVLAHHLVLATFLSRCLAEDWMARAAYPSLGPSGGSDSYYPLPLTTCTTTDKINVKKFNKQQ